MSEQVDLRGDPVDPDPEPSIWWWPALALMGPSFSVACVWVLLFLSGSEPEQIPELGIVATFLVLAAIAGVLGGVLGVLGFCVEAGVRIYRWVIDR